MAACQIQLQPMNADELSVQVVDRRLQVDLDQEEGVKNNNSNEFMPEQGFESKAPVEYEEQEEEEEPHFKLEKLLPKQNQKERLIEQNIKLKTQIYELAKQLDQILLKDKGKKKTYGIGLNKIEEEDELIREKRLQTQKQQIEIADLKHRIFIAKRQLESVYNNDAITAKEDQNKNLKAELKTLTDQKDGHVNIQQVQSKALKISRNEDEYGDKISKVVMECGRLKKESKLLIQRINNSEKILMKAHDSHVCKRQNLRQIEQKMALNKQKQKHKSKKQNEILITDQMIESLQTQIKRLQMERKEGQKNWQQKIKAVDTQLILKRGDQQRRLLILRQKERQLRINELRIKQLRKMVRQGGDGSGNTNRSAQSMDMSQFRHKRNIIRYQK